MTGDPDPHDVAAALRVSIGLLLRQMRQVRVAGELTVPETSALARLEQISPQSMGATLSALEARGLVRRGPDAHDGRRAVLSVTDLGRQLLRDKRDARTGQFARALGVNPLGHLLAARSGLAGLPAAARQTLTGREFFPELISGPFRHGLV